jgi:hypothetical protein
MTVRICPLRHPALLLGSLALDEPAHLALWKTLAADSTVEEVNRNVFIRQPSLREP